METGKTNVLLSGISPGYEETVTGREQAIVDKDDEKIADETADENASKLRVDEGSDSRLRPRLFGWLKKLWERECPLLPNDYFDNHGN